MSKTNVGYIRELSNGTWKAIIEYPMVDGKRRRKSRVCPTESKAKKALIDLNVEREEYLKRGDHQVKRLLFKDAVKVFKTKISKRISVGLLKKKTQLSYNQLSDKLCKEFGSMDCHSEITSKVFEGYLERLMYEDKLAVASIVKCKIVMNMIFKENKLPLLTIELPCGKIKKSKNHARPLSDKERSQIDDYIKTTLTHQIGNKKKQWLIIFLYYFTLYTGCRCGEVAGLKWSAIREDEGVIVIENNLVYIPGEGLLDETPKTADSVRRLVVSQSVFKLLNRLRKVYLAYDYPRSEYVFITRDGRPLFPRNILRDFQEMCKRAGLTNHHTFHDIRHTNITTKIVNGVDVKTVSLMAGHSDTSVTLNTYSHYWREAAQRAASLLDSKIGEHMNF